MVDINYLSKRHNFYDGNITLLKYIKMICRRLHLKMKKELTHLSRY